jgi:5-(carboxyamino)imidazole ribonucleotide mutase
MKLANKKPKSSPKAAPNYTIHKINAPKKTSKGVSKPKKTAESDPDGKPTVSPRRLKRDDPGSPIVGIVMGSDSDLVWMEQAADALEKFAIPYELRIISAHRTPDLVMAYGGSARSRGLRVILAGAGGAAHLPGMLAAHTTLPVVGVPCPVGPMQGEDALWSIVQMPKGVPVATVGIGSGWNAGILAAQILSLGTNSEAGRILSALEAHKLEMEQTVARMNERLI